jgi:hypothetical protein
VETITVTEILIVIEPMETITVTAVTEIITVTT